jgi:dUTP pyrophosphatase
MNKFEYVSWSDKDFDLPTRSTKNSAGYDFHSPKMFLVKPGESVEISLEVKVQINSGEFLMIVPRSSLGFKNGNHITITNTVGVIDQDYYNNAQNEGEIRARLHNFGDKDFVVYRNDKLLQGIFVKFDLTADDLAEGERTGGFGSTGR